MAMSSYLMMNQTTELTKSPSTLKPSTKYPSIAQPKTQKLKANAFKCTTFQIKPSLQRSYAQVVNSSASDNKGHIKEDNNVFLTYHKTMDMDESDDNNDVDGGYNAMYPLTASNPKKRPLDQGLFASDSDMKENAPTKKRRLNEDDETEEINDEDDDDILVQNQIKIDEEQTNDDFCFDEGWDNVTRMHTLAKKVHTYLYDQQHEMQLAMYTQALDALVVILNNNGINVQSCYDAADINSRVFYDVNSDDIGHQFAAQFEEIYRYFYNNLPPHYLRFVCIKFLWYLLTTVAPRLVKLESGNRRLLSNALLFGSEEVRDALRSRISGFQIPVLSESCQEDQLNEYRLDMTRICSYLMEEAEKKVKQQLKWQNQVPCMPF